MRSSLLHVASFHCVGYSLWISCASTHHLSLSLCCSEPPWPVCAGKRSIEQEDAREDAAARAQEHFKLVALTQFGQFLRCIDVNESSGRHVRVVYRLIGLWFQHVDEMLVRGGDAFVPESSRSLRTRPFPSLSVPAPPLFAGQRFDAAHHQRGAVEALLAAAVPGVVSPQLANDGRAVRCFCATVAPLVFASTPACAVTARRKARFQEVLASLIERAFDSYPYHCILHLLALVHGGDGQAAQKEAAQSLMRRCDCTVSISRCYRLGDCVCSLDLSHLAVLCELSG